MEFVSICTQNLTSKREFETYIDMGVIKVWKEWEAVYSHKPVTFIGISFRVFERLYWCQDGEALKTYFIMPWSRVYHYQLHCSYFSISPLVLSYNSIRGSSGTWYENFHFTRSSSMDRERVRKQVRSCHSSHGGFESLNAPVIHNQNQTLYYYTDSRKFDKICCEKRHT